MLSRSLDPPKTPLQPAKAVKESLVSGECTKLKTWKPSAAKARIKPATDSQPWGKSEPP